MKTNKRKLIKFEGIGTGYVWLYLGTLYETNIIFNLLKSKSETLNITSIKKYPCRNPIRKKYVKVLPNWVSSYNFKKYYLKNAIQYFRGYYIYINTKTGTTITPEYLSKILVDNDYINYYILSIDPKTGDLGLHCNGIKIVNNKISDKIINNLEKWNNKYFNNNMKILYTYDKDIDTHIIGIGPENLRKGEMFKKLIIPFLKELLLDYSDTDFLFQEINENSKEEIVYKNY